ncbi:MAG: polysaccharide deacetylase family protein [Akkermansiaceae bacterium]
MKRRTILQMTPGVVLGVASCSAGKGEPAPSTGASSPQDSHPGMVKMGTNTQYRPPAYASHGLRNPDVNLPSNFSRGTVTHSRGSSAYPHVAMSFDDGPHPQNTPRLLDMLRKRNIRATFYVIGNNVDRYPHIARRIVAEGHEIGNHTYTHRKLTSLSSSEVRKEMQRTQDAIARATGVKPRTMRPPYGALRNDQRQMIMKDFGYPTVLWSVDPRDWQRPGPSVVTSRILAGAGNGAIILAHDLHAPTVAAMPATFEGLLSRGYQFVTVSQLLAQKG